jgi:hypothetical protein
MPALLTRGRKNSWARKLDEKLDERRSIAKELTTIRKLIFYGGGGAVGRTVPNGRAVSAGRG